MLRSPVQRILVRAASKSDPCAANSRPKSQVATAERACNATRVDTSRTPTIAIRPRREQIIVPVVRYTIPAPNDGVAEHGCGSHRAAQCAGRSALAMFSKPVLLPGGPTGLTTPVLLGADILNGHRSSRPRSGRWGFGVTTAGRHEALQTVTVGAGDRHRAGRRTARRRRRRQTPVRGRRSEWYVATPAAGSCLVVSLVSSSGVQVQAVGSPR